MKDSELVQLSPDPDMDPEVVDHNICWFRGHIYGMSVY